MPAVTVTRRSSTTIVGRRGSVCSDTSSDRPLRKSTANASPIMRRELADRRRVTVHRQDDRRMQPVGDLAHVGQRLRHAAVDRHHDNVEPADGGVVGVLQPMVQMAEMADAQAGDLEDEDGVAVDLHGRRRCGCRSARCGCRHRRPRARVWPGRPPDSSRAARTRSRDPERRCNGCDAPCSW